MKNWPNSVSLLLGVVHRWIDMIWECQFFLFFKYVIAFFIGIQISRWNCFLYWFYLSNWRFILWVSKCGAVVECRKIYLKTQVRLQAVLLLRVWGNVFIPKKFDLCKIMSEKFDIYNKIFFRDAVWIGPASPDAGVELLRQLFLQCGFNLGIPGKHCKWWKNTLMKKL